MTVLTLLVFFGTILVKVSPAVSAEVTHSQFLSQIQLILHVVRATSSMQHALIFLLFVAMVTPILVKEDRFFDEGPKIKDQSSKILITLFRAGPVERKTLARPSHM